MDKYAPVFRVWDEISRRWDNGPLYIYPNEPIRKQGRIITFFSGVYDTNNKPIFEGDIVEDVGDNYVRHTVYYDPDQCSFRLSDCRNIAMDDLGQYDTPVKVVGNIFEQEAISFLGVGPVKYGFVGNPESKKIRDCLVEAINNREEELSCMCSGPLKDEDTEELNMWKEALRLYDEKELK